MKKTCFLPLFILVWMGCTHYTPKPSGYFRIETGEHTYRNYQGSAFSFDFSTKAIIDPVSKSATNEWFNISYPSLGARIHCSYLSIQPENFINAMEDSRKFVYRHSTKADDIQQQIFQHPESRLSGVLYEISGNVASPIQFTLSDSIRHFFRGSVYFNCTPNADSIAPVLQFIREDILELIETFQFKK